MKLDLDIHNYYEHLVMEYLNSHKEFDNYDVEFIGDLCCLALSHLPARYIRHEIDMAFYLSGQQRTDMATEVQQAIDQSYQYLQTKIKPQTNELQPNLDNRNE